MFRMLSFVLFVGIALCVMFAPHAFAETATTTLAADGAALTPDPYVALGVVSTDVVQALKCPCVITGSCAYNPIGSECSDTVGCCHCAGANPATRKCVGT